MIGWTSLRAADGHRLAAWQAVPPAGTPIRGAIVVLPEIFGVNAHIRSLCDRYAAQGWSAIAPSLFDRAEPAVELGYDAAAMARARDLKAGIRDADALLDVQVAVDAAAAGRHAVAVIGFCWGGTLAWLAAARLPGVRAAVAYYGTQIASHLGETPRAPVLLHFGAHDAHIPPDHVDAIARAHPRIALHRYPAGHGFNCDARAAFEPASAALAAERTHAFLKEALPC
ncbi:MAG: dienelactone hydrolase family protein [Burkholderiales bacterium]|nr:dienelactone hydrolase family protein [Burkholderiales bacterium]